MKTLKGEALIVQQVKAAVPRASENYGDVLLEVRSAVVDGEGDIPNWRFPAGPDIHFRVVIIMVHQVLSREVGAEKDVSLEAGAGCGVKSGSSQDWAKFKSKAE